MTLAIRRLIAMYLDTERVEASFEIMGVDTQLIEDGTYFAVEYKGGIVGCGGWSRRATLFGGDHSANRSARLLEPEREPARVRAMYTHPDYVRRGIGRLVLSLCEAAAARDNFRSLELVATVSGEPLYSSYGFSVSERLEVPTSRGVTVPCARMRKQINGVQPSGFLVRSFYHRIWNDGDLQAAWELLTPGFAFRGSLGPELQGIPAFVDYVRSVRRALADYRCDILDCVSEGNRAFAKMRFSGRHTGPFLGHAPSGKAIEWLGAALFQFDDALVAQLWVLGDLAGLEAMLKANAGESPSTWTD